MNRVTYSLTIILSVFLISNLTRAQNHLFNESYDDKSTITAKLLPLVGKPPTSGYMPFRLTLKNGSKTDRNWTLEFTSESEDDYGYYRNRNQTPTLSSNFQYNCPPESTKTYDIMVPLVTAIASSHHDVVTSNLSVNLETAGNDTTNTISTSQNFDTPAVLLSTKLYVQHSSKFNSFLPHTSRSYRTGNQDYATEFTPSTMSSDWRAYSGFDALICTDEDWLEIPTEARNAILEWNRLGGHLYLYKLNQASNFKSLDIDSSNDQSVGLNKRTFGSVTLTPLSKIKSLDVKAVHNLITSNTDPIKIKAINSDYSSHSSSWNLLSTLGKLSFSPFYLILILIAFGILVGPVNLFVFAKSGQRHKLFITTPLIAIGASVALVTLIIIQDGFGGHGERVQLVEVRADGGENKAYVWQEQAARTGVLFNGSFETSSPALMSPVPIIESRFSRVTRDNTGGACNYTANHGENGITATGDWFQSRSAHGHYLESVIPTRGRISLKSNQGAPVLTSSFDYQIDHLFYIDDSGSTWQASNIAAGDSPKFSLSNPADTVKIIHEYNENMSHKLKKKLTTLQHRKGHFIALTNNAPAIETLASIKWTNTTSIITGPVIK